MSRSFLSAVPTPTPTPTPATPGHQRRQQQLDDNSPTNNRWKGEMQYKTGRYRSMLRKKKFALALSMTAQTPTSNRKRHHERRTTEGLLRALTLAATALTASKTLEARLNFSPAPLTPKSPTAGAAPSANPNASSKVGRDARPRFRLPEKSKLEILFSCGCARSRDGTEGQVVGRKSNENRLDWTSVGMAER